MSSRIPKTELEPEFKKLGNNIRRERVARSITQEKLAENAEIAVRTLQKIEAGKINILVTTVKRLRKALGCGWDDLI